MSHFKCFVELVAVILCLGSVSLAIRCPSPDWYNRLTTDKCYYVHGRVGSTASGGPSETLTWAELMSECRVRGGQILTLDDSNEFEWLKANLDGTQRYWIGLTYENLKWEWYDGETYRDFVQSALPGLRVQEPTGNEQSKRQQRGLLRYNGSIKNFEFYMMSATNYNSNGYICRAGLTTRAWCRTEDGWSYRNGRCYRYNVDLRSFSDAERFCLADGGYISVPNTDEENDRLNLWLLNQVKVNIGWIGISVKKNASTTYEDVRWADGAALLTPETNHWKDKDVVGTINKMTVGQSYCGEVWAQRCDLDWCAEEDIVAKWFFNNSCSTRRPFVCETLINKCPYGWTELDEHCYQVHAGSDRLQWQPARDKCKVYGADLVMITTERIQTFLMAAFSAVATWTDPNLFWIGLNNGYTQWLNGTALSYTNWNATVDLTGGGVNGAAYINGDTKRPNSVELGKWFPTVNTQSLNFVCQGHYSSVIPSEVVPLADITCDPPFLKYHRGCYLVVKQKMNRDGAQQYCQAQGNSVLAIVESFGENVWLQNLVTEDSWLGLRITGARPVNGIMRFVYEYSDKRPVGEGAFFNFQDNRHPSNLETMTQFCAVMAGNNSQYNISDFGGKASHGRWFHAPCQEAREFICYHDGTPTAVDTTYDDSHNDPACGAGWFRYGDNCYRVHEDEAPWRLAKQTCQSADPSADLLWMTTKAEQQFIRNFIEKNQSSGIPLGGEEEDYWEEVWEDFYWIDFFADTPTSNWYWPYRESTNKWEIPVSVVDWHNGHPKIPSGLAAAKNPVCAYIETSYYSSRWISATCNQAHRYICKKVLAPSVAPTTTPTPTALPPGQTLGCREGWYLSNGRCAHYNPNLLTWLEAQTSCKNIRGDLFSVRNVADFDFLRPFGGGSWIGLNSIVDWHNPRVFEWSDKTPMLYTPWDIESAHSNGSHLGIHDENCGAFTLRGFDMYSCAERKTSVCVAPLIGQIVVAPTGGIAIPQDFGCDPWGFGRQGSCYYFGQDPQRPPLESAYPPSQGWDASRDFCRTRYPGSDLIVINTAEEQAFISLFVNRFGADFWIGLREQAGPVMSAFSRWTDGTAVTAAKWAFGEPQQKPPALRCVALYSQHNDVRSPGDWYVDECGTPKFALCEGPRRFVPISPTTPRPVVVEQGCPSGWMTADKGLLPSCYKAYSNSANSTTPKLSWAEAEAFCRRFPTGHLATVATTDATSFITYNVIQSPDRYFQAWIGLHQAPDDQDRWQWADGTALTGTNFQTNVPISHETDRPDCVAMEVFNGKWIPQNCLQSWGWVCEIDKGVYPEGQLIEEFPAEIPISRECGNSTQEGEWYLSTETNECLYFSRRPDSWRNAQTTCQALGSNLVTVTEKSHDFITRLVGQFGEPNSYWLGLYQVNPDTLEHQWVDQQAAVSFFRPWATDQPNPSGREQCVAHQSWSGKWYDFNCGHQLPFICHKSDRVVLPFPTQDPKLGACPQDWTEFQGMCYFFSGPANATFDEAETMCRRSLPQGKDQRGGSLVSIHSSLENDFIVAQVRRTYHRHNPVHPGEGGGGRPPLPDHTRPTGQPWGPGGPGGPGGRPDFSMFEFWIGLHDNQGDKVLGWTDQTTFDFNNWHPSEPVTFRPTSCIDFGVDTFRVGRWMNVGCDKRRAYICKGPKQLELTPPAPTAWPNCPMGYSQLGENCFRVERMTLAEPSWLHGQNKCKLYGDGHGDVASIWDIYENAEIRVLLNEKMAADGLTEARAWIGMQELYGAHAWISTCPIVFSNFANLYSQPADNAACVHMMADGKWMDQPCNTQAEYVVCERRNVPCPSFFNRTDDSLYCKENFPHECGRSCYHIAAQKSHQTGTHWNSIEKARDNCTALGGRLASIRTVEDQQCIAEYIKDAVSPMWIGLNGVKNPVSQELEWKWEMENGTGFFTLPTSYVNWDVGMPNYPPFSTRTCVDIQPNGKWANHDCGPHVEPEEKGYICENRKERKDGYSRPTPATRPVFTNPSASPPTQPPIHPVTLPLVTQLTTKSSDEVERAAGEPKTAGMSDGSVAGLVIGILLIVAIIAGVLFIRITGRTSAVVSRIKSTTAMVLPRRFQGRPDEDKFSLNPRASFATGRDRDPNMNMGYVGSDSYS